jgi:DNA-binding LacI/PurR family transcriptional regulator
MSRRHVTLADVARKAGTSVSAASLVLNNGGRSTIKVGPETADRIRLAAEKLKYSPNTAAQSLVSQRTYNIGYILADSVGSGWRNEYFAAYMGGAEAACRELGYNLIIRRCGPDEAREFAFSGKLSGRNVDGLIIVGEFAPQVAEYYSGFDLPVVVLNWDPAPGQKFVTVSTEPHSRIKIWKYALSMGHKRILFLFEAFEKSFESEYLRVTGIAEEFNRRVGANILPLPPGAGNFSWDASMGEYLFEKWSAFPEHERPTMIIGDDLLPRMLSLSFFPRNIKTPEDLSVIITFDFNICSVFHPELTALVSNHEREAYETVRMITGHLDNDKQLENIAIDGERFFAIAERGSVRRIL